MNMVTKSVTKWKVNNVTNKVKKASVDFANDTKHQMSEWKTDIKQKWYKMTSKQQVSPINDIDAGMENKLNDAKKRKKSHKLSIKNLFKYKDTKSSNGDNDRTKASESKEDNHTRENSKDIYKDPKIKAYLKQLEEFKQNQAGQSIESKPTKKKLSLSFSNFTNKFKK